MGDAIFLREAVSVAGRFPLLAGASFDVSEGEVVHVRGANGAGKTSLLRACAGLIPFTSGTAVVLGHDLRVDRESVRREVGLLGHASFLYDDLSVEDNLRFSLRAARVSVDAIDGALERLGLEGRLRKSPVGRLSTGQRRRVGLALLVARRPRLLLLDEPHAGLDDGGRSIVDEIVSEARAAGSTVVLASHDFDRAELIADRIVVIAGGQIVDGGAPIASRVGDRSAHANAHDGVVRLEVGRGVA